MQYQTTRRKPLMTCIDMLLLWITEEEEEGEGEGEGEIEEEEEETEGRTKMLNDWLGLKL